MTDTQKRKISQLFDTLEEKYDGTPIGTIIHGDLHGHGLEFSAEIELSDNTSASEDDPDELPSYPFLALRLQPDEDHENMIPTVQLCWWVGGEGIADQTRFNVDSDTDVKQLAAWFDKNRVAFEVSDDFNTVAHNAFESILSCAKEAQSRFIDGDNLGDDSAV